MAEIKNIYFIGIAGSGMSGLALMAQAEGFNVAGSDQQSSLYLQAVLAAGIPVTLEQKTANILERDIDVVVVSAAIKEDNPELACARQRGLPIWPRARMLAWLGRDKRTWAVAGTHGKTTTSSMLASTLANLGADPSWLVGGVLVEYEATARLGQGPDYVIEADESDESFTQLRPYWMIITNIEPDHLDHYPDLAAIDQAFAAFLATLEPNGRVIYCREDAGLTQLVAESGQPAISYGFRADADYRAEPLDQGFLVHGPAGLRLPLQIPAAPGLHNILNATAVVASLMEAGFEPSAIARALAAFQGVHRRFELIGEAGGVQVADDYGHHPTEIKATLAAARRMGYRRIHLLFQPHRYTRTQQLFPDFVNTFDDVDSLVLLDIYPAGEAAIPGVNSQKLLAAIQAAHPGLSTESALDWEAVPALLAG
ncbi:MAG: UDP-N-acetylmuramate--L-alanine ligase, partial [Actinomycetia bacterium]|nr:UDP-N-acetylmuramate--L-alanine ligase [Actinomycetes bacterium]